MLSGIGAMILLSAAGPWTWQDAKTTARLRGLCVVDERVAWAGGTGGTVIRTVDGGKTWERRDVPGAEELDLRDIEAIDDRTAYVLSIGEGESSRIYKTVNGGATWEEVYRNPDPKGFLDALAFRDADHGLAMGDPVDGRFVIVRTEDGGRSWTKVPPEGMPEALPGEGGFAASGTCLVVGEGGRAWFATGGADRARVFRSEDDGRTWAAVDVPIDAGRPSAGVFSLAFDGDRGVAVGGDYQEPERLGRRLALTDDGGRTWHPAGGDGPGGYRSCMAFLTGSEGRTLIAVGPTGSDVSRDGGQTWRPLDPAGFHAVGLAGPTAGWATGDDGRLAKFEGVPADE